MRRAERLFQLIQILRHQRVTTAKVLADELSVSERTVYRDIQDLATSGVPIEGEPGVGYMLRGFDLPPLMFDSEEIEALVFGLRVVENWADPSLSRAARSVMEKLEQVLPGAKVQFLRDTQLFAPNDGVSAEVTIDVAVLRGAVRKNLCVEIRYRDGQQQDSERRLRPLALTFFGPVWLLLAWCELRNDFRSFRLDRIESLELSEPFEPEAGKQLEDYIERMRREWAPERSEAERAGGSEGSQGDCGFG